MPKVNIQLVPLDSIRVRLSIPLVGGKADGAVPGVDDYKRPGGVDFYRRPGGVDLYKRP